jgi:hypothetical protein
MKHKKAAADRVVEGAKLGKGRGEKSWSFLKAAARPAEAAP